MAHSSHFIPALSPLHSSSSLVAAEPSVRTNTGRRCSILCCLEIEPDIHISQSHLYNLRLELHTEASSNLLACPVHTHLMPLLSDPDTVSTHLVPITSLDHKFLPAQGKMSRLRQRMRCRRGNSRGHHMRRPSTSTSDSSSPSFDNYTGHYPETRIGRGRGRLGQFHSVVGSTHTPASSANILAPPQTAQFRFQCSLDRPSVIATITIEFKEEPTGSDAFTHTAMMNANDDKEMRNANKQGTSQGTDIKRKAPSCSENQDKKNEEEQGCSKRGCYKDKEAQQAEDDDMDAYWCPVVEEPPSTSHDA